MVYRYESDQDTLHGLPHSGADLSAAGARRAPAGPSPSRFPTPDLPPVPRRAAPEPTRAVVPAPAAPAPVTAPAAPAGPATAPQPAGPENAPQPAPVSAVVDPTVRVARTGGRLWQVVVGGAAVLVLLAICGLGTAAVLMERQSTPDPQTPPPAAPGAAPRSPEPTGADLDSRDTDPAPLTAKEVFPGRRLVVADGQPAYQVLKTHSSASCAVAATEDIADLLVRLGCNQVVRGTVRAPGDTYLATAGLFNLTDRATAERVRERVREMLQQRQGRFLALAAGSGTEALTTAASRVAWQVRGHYVAYCLVVRADGQPVGANDPDAKRVLHDLVELHLDRGVLERRSDGDLVQPNPDSTGTTRTDDD